MRLRALLLLLLSGCGPVQAPRGPHERHEPFADWRMGLQAGARPTSPSATPPRFAEGEPVESIVSPGGSFRIHFSRSGPNAVAAADADGNGVPDAVDTVARAYDRVADFYAGLGFQRPPDDAWVGGDAGGDGRFDVYLVDFAGRADGAFRLDGCQGESTRCTGHMLEENDFAGYGYGSYEEAVATLASHEFFHAVQAAYHPGLGSVASEGTAVWASERFEPALDDLEHFTAAYMTRPDRSLVLDPDGPAASFSYGAGLYFQFLGERFGDGVVRSLWEESVLAPGVRWPVLVDTVLRRDWGADFDTAFAEFALWNLATGPRAGRVPGYARGGGYAALTVSSRTLPMDEPSVRVAAASARYFEVEGGSETVSAVFEPQVGEAPGGVHLLVAAVTANAVLRVSRVDGPGVLSAKVDAADATHVMVAVVDGRMEGTGRYGRLCITGDASGAPCVAVQPGPDAGTDGGTDGGVGNGTDGGTDGGTPVEPRPPSEEGGCGAAPGGTSWALLAVLLAFGVRAASAQRSWAPSRSQSRTARNRAVGAAARRQATQSVPRGRRIERRPDSGVSTTTRPARTAGPTR
ncbi:MXAN_6640 family putative metalloprotease [Pyxidicoccus fallax]|uniref:MXAN_6640 family putative metalloprotease n=1 Tax=Pyxidicoccus fallax TaxID=394095 RepID=UPI001FEB6473|nr:MXAN_6640 family putative metalloprotease [Pyxidicoccus fallax]